ncbi:MAG TPA: hypothetical protein PLP23_03285 [Panacibacter sp.]|nr:hypothetical protein [Panacibacter sp.]
MQSQPYSYDRKYSTRYTFISKGKKGVIVKIVEFTPTSVKNVLNLGFGDLLSDGSVDDTANSNNGDIIKVLATVISIVEDFTAEYPDIKIVFAGSTVRRTELYHRILKMYYTGFKKEFIITALKDDGNESYSEVLFEPGSNNKYVAFFIKRK